MISIVIASLLMASGVMHANAQPVFPVQAENATIQISGTGGGPESDPPSPNEVRQDVTINLGNLPQNINVLKPTQGSADLQITPLPENPNSAIVDSTMTPMASAGWSTIMSEDFEGAFPTGSWSTFDNNGKTDGEYFWGSTTFKPHNGLKSAWAARNGANGLDPAISLYPDNAISYMVYGPFDLSDATDAELLFYFWINFHWNAGNWRFNWLAICEF
jgi:hypothetical protein